MLPELSIERVFRRELDALPIPAEFLWVPVRSDAGGTFVRRTALIVATALLVGGAVFAVNDARESGVAGPGSRATVQPRLTCLPNGVCIAPVPILVRSPELGYNLWLPGDWRETAATGPTTPGLVSRRVFTARSSEEEARVGTAGQVPAWDLTVEIWERQGRSALQWAGSDLCVAPTSCGISPMTLRGASAVQAKVPATPSSRYVRGIYVERGDRILILRFVVDPDVERPSGVTEDTFDQIVAKIGLV